MTGTLQQPKNARRGSVTPAGAQERRSRVFHISDEVWADMQEGFARAERREFVSDEALAAADKRFGI